MIITCINILVGRRRKHTVIVKRWDPCKHIIFDRLYIHRLVSVWTIYIRVLDHQSMRNKNDGERYKNNFFYFASVKTKMTIKITSTHDVQIFIRKTY